MNFTEPVAIDISREPWLASPRQGVERKPLEREDAESGHATSIVRYASGSSFTAHNHPYGEEIYVVEGIFSDEFGDYPTGTYIRNPPGSTHTPFSKLGCTLFVKLGQFAKGDDARVCIDTNREPWLQGQGKLTVMPLHSLEVESTALVKWPARERFIPHKHFGGEEILVLSGVFIDEHGEYPALSWLRSPHLSQHCPFVKEETLILVKVGHLSGSHR